MFEFCFVEVPCNLAAIAELQRLGLEVHNARCYPSNYGIDHNVFNSLSFIY